MGVSLLALGVYFYLKYEVESDPDSDISQDTVKSIAFVPLVAVLAFIAAFSIGLGPLAWVMNSELFSKEAKVIRGSITEIMGENSHSGWDHEQPIMYVKFWVVDIFSPLNK